MLAEDELLSQEDYIRATSVFLQQRKITDLKSA
jgi:uncharacterized protein YqgQ